MKKIRFYKYEGKWYADVPSHSMSENIMIGGSDEFLECLYQYVYHKTIYDSVERQDIDSVTLIFTDKKPDNYLFRLRQYAHNGYGANYNIFQTCDGNCYKITVDRLWLCNVVHTVCGEHPKTIYITEVL